MVVEIVFNINMADLEPKSQAVTAARLPAHSSS